MIEIKTGDIPCCVYISNIFNHLHYKSIILNCIKSLGIFGLNPDVYSGQRVFNTDWHLSKALAFKDPDYRKVVRPIIDNHNKALTQYLGYEEPILYENLWFQQYQKDDYHWWHRHQLSIFSNVYYVDLPAGTSKTSFRFLDKEFQIEVEEGQILTFPSFIEHCSPPNLSNKIKTVISFNSS